MNFSVFMAAKNDRSLGCCFVLCVMRAGPVYGSLCFNGGIQMRQVRNFAMCSAKAQQVNEGINMHIYLLRENTLFFDLLISKTSKWKILMQVATMLEKLLHFKFAFVTAILFERNKITKADWNWILLHKRRQPVTVSKPQKRKSCIFHSRFRQNSKAQFNCLRK